jgi:thiamine biosynthesis lipoprotein
MGTEFNLIVYTTDDESARRASRRAYERVKELDEALSDYNPESELMRLCEHAGGPPVPVGADLFRNLGAALDMARRSDGAFDPTVNPLVRLWRRARRERKLPDPKLLEEARALVDYRAVKLDPKARTVQLLKPRMKLDLGGIAKGDAAQQMVEAVRALGITQVLAAAAGDIVVGDPPPGATGWRIAIAPLEPGAPEQSILLAHAAVSTSGDAEQYVVIDGRRYSHIVDPRTGLGVVDRASVTVVTPDGTLSDALETTVYVLGPERGLALVESLPGAAARIVRKVEGKIEVHDSSRWKDVPKASTVNGDDGPDPGAGARPTPPG